MKNKRTVTLEKQCTKDEIEFLLDRINRSLSKGHKNVVFKNEMVGLLENLKETFPQTKEEALREAFEDHIHECVNSECIEFIETDSDDDDENYIDYKKTLEKYAKKVMEIEGKVESGDFDL